MAYFHESQVLLQKHSQQETESFQLFSYLEHKESLTTVFTIYLNQPLSLNYYFF